MDAVEAAPEAASHRYLAQLRGQAGIDAQAVIVRPDPQNSLRYGIERPCRRARQPAVFGLAEARGGGTRDHLAIDIGLGTVQCGVVQIGRTGAAVNIEGPSAVSQHDLGQNNPRIVVTEDTAVFLVSRRIGADFAKLGMIPGIGRGEQSHAMRCEQTVAHGVQRALGITLLDSYARHDQEALRFDIDLPLFTFPASHLAAVRVIGAQEPLAVPAVRQH